MRKGETIVEVCNVVNGRMCVDKWQTLSVLHYHLNLEWLSEWNNSYDEYLTDSLANTSVYVVS